MGGFAIGLGSLGQAASQYGSQIRSILESRRHDFANLMSQQAATEEDPDTRAAMLQHATDATSGKPMGKILQDFSGTMQKRVKDEQALHKGIQGISAVTGGGQQQPPPPPPGATPAGQVPGTGGNALPPQAAAQPSTNPLTSIGGGISSPPDINPVADTTALPPVPAQPVAAAPQSVPPVAAAQGIPPVAANGPFSVPGLPTPETQDQIDAYFNSLPAWHTPHGQERLQGAYNARLTHAEGLRNTLEAQQATIAYKQAGLQRMKENGTFSKLPAITQGQLEAEAYGLPAPPMSAGLMEPRMISAGTMGADAPPGQVEYGSLNPVRHDKRYRVMQVPATGETFWQPETDQTVITQTATGPQVSNRNTGGSIAPLAGAVNPSTITPHLVTLPNGRLAFVSDAGASTGVQPVQTSGINPAFVPTTSTSVQPGAPPITTTHTKGGGIGAVANSGSAPSIQPVHGGATAKPFEDPLAKANYETYVSGGEKPTGRQMDGVRLYAQQHGLPMPGVTNAQGLKTIATLDPVMKQIDDLTTRLKEVNGKSLVADYLKYKAGFQTPYDDIFTGTAFERLRSGSAALQGIGSRALPVFNEGLKHTPNFDRLHGLNPDSTALMIDKLTEAKKIIQEERSAAEKQTKSGVLLPQGNNGISAVTADPLGIR